MADIDQAQIALRDSVAESFDAWYAGRGWWAQVEMQELLYRFALKASDIVADIGCGTGRLVEVIAPMVERIFAGDFSPASIEILQQKCDMAEWGRKVSPFVADMSQPLDLATASVDKVISLQAIQHVRVEGRATALAEFRRVLRPGGRLFLEVYAFPSWVFDKSVSMEGLIGDTLYFRRWTADDLRHDVAAAGFDVLGVYPILCWPQLRRFTAVGAWLEMLAHRGWLPTTKVGYWLIEARSPAET